MIGNDILFTKQMRRFGGFPTWANVLLVAFLLFCVWWLANLRIAGVPGWLEHIGLRIAGVPDWLEHVGLLRWLRKLDPQWVAAVATFVLAVVALFQDRLRIALFRARLDVGIEPGVSIPWGPLPAYHFRLGVTSRDSIAAKFVEILVTDLWVDGRRAPWWSPMALGWTDGNKPHRDVLSGNTTRLCDFVMMVEPGPQTQIALARGGFTRPVPPDFDSRSRACIKIMTAVNNPNGGPNVLFPGRYIFGLELAAENATPTKRFFEIQFDGQWGPDPNSDLISISEVGVPR